MAAVSGDFGRRRSPVCVLEGQQPLLVLHDSLTACQPACWTAARRNFDWDALAARKTKPPYVPKVGGWAGCVNAYVSANLSAMCRCLCVLLQPPLRCR